MNFVIALFCFLFVAVFSSQTLVDICDTMIVATAIYLIIKNKDYSFLRTISKTWYFWIGWLIVIFLGLFINNNPMPWLYFLEFRWCISFASMIYLLLRITNIDVFINSLSITMLFLNFVSIFLYFARNDERAGGIYNGVMAYSQNLGMVTCFFVTYLLYSTKNKFSIKNQKVLLALSLSCIILVLITLTRGIWIASAIGISLSSFFIHKKIFTYTVVTIIFLFSVLTLFSPSFKSRIRANDYLTQTSNFQRKNILRANLEIFKDYPILGTGYTQNNLRLTEYYKKLNIPEDEFKSHAHNQYLQFAAGTGILGLIFYLIFLSSIFFHALNGYFKSKDMSIRILYIALVSAIVSFMIASLTESNFSISKNRFLFLFFCALIVAQKYKDKTTDSILK